MHKRAQRGVGWLRPLPPFLMTVGGMSHSGEITIGGSMEYLVEMVQIENSLRNYVNFTLGNGVSLAFKTLKPMSFWGLPPTPGAMMESLMKIVQIDNSVRNYMWILPLILPSKTGFLGLLKCKNQWASGSWTPGLPAPGAWNLLWKWYKLRIHYKITCEFYPDITLINRFSYRFWIAKTQWRNRWGGRVPPETFDQEISADLLGKEKQGKRGKWGKKKENWKREDGKLKMEGGKVTKWGEAFFFFFFFLPFTFQNHWNLFWVYQNWNFLPGKSISHREKNLEKWLCPLRKMFLLHPCWCGCLPPGNICFYPYFKIIGAKKYLNLHVSTISSQFLSWQLPVVLWLILIGRWYINIVTQHQWIRPGRRCFCGKIKFK